MPGHGFVAAGRLFMTDDASDRFRLGANAVDDSLWLFEATVFINRRFGLGMETMPLGSVTRPYERHGVHDKRRRGGARCTRHGEIQSVHRTTSRARYSVRRRNRISALGIPYADALSAGDNRDHS